MDIEHLNKSQIILLTLLVSFVTSIATGIVTVSLMNQAPTQMEATVNHIIERTVQQVVPSAPVTSTVKTIVVKNDDLVAESIASVQKSLIRIVDVSAPDLLVTRGVIISAKGTALADRGSFSSSAHYAAILPDGSRVPITQIAVASTSSIAQVSLDLGTSTPAFSVAALADQSKLSLGQTVIRIGGTGGDTIGTGVIALLPAADDQKKVIEATVSSVTPGSVLISLFGEVVGIITTDSLVQGSDFYSLPDIAKISASAAKTTQAASAGAAAEAAAK